MKLESIGRTESSSVDRATLCVVAFAMGLGLFVFILVPIDPHRLHRFAGEHVALFDMKDSTPLRRAYLTFFIALPVGALFVRWIGTPLRFAWTIPASVIAFGALALIMLNVAACNHSGAVPLKLATPWVDATYAIYVGSVVVFVCSRWLPLRAIGATSILVVLLAWLPGATDLMSRVPVSELPWVDQHISALFSGAHMLRFGYRLFVDVPVGYGTLAPVALAAVVRSGAKLDFGTLFRLVELCQLLTFCLFICAAWAMTRGAEAKARLVAILLLIIVAAPFLSLGSEAVLFPNQSGFRFVMLPVAVLTLLVLRSGPIVGSTALCGAVAMVALLHNTETGIVILAGLGLAWLLRAQDQRATHIARAVGAGIAAAAGIGGLVILVHRAALGVWPSLGGAGGPLGLFQSFGAGFGGAQPPLRMAVFVIFGHAGYLVVQALARLLGRNTDAPDIVSAGLATMLVVWAPYYANRPDDWNLWSFLVLYALLLVPRVAANMERPWRLAFAALLLVTPVPLVMVGKISDTLAAKATPSVQEHCAAGLSLPAEACAEHGARAGELLRLARAGDVLWMTAYPYLTLQQTGLRPLVAPLDLYAAALDEADLDGVAQRIRAARPLALLLDQTTPSLVGDAIPAPIRSLHRRIATLAGFAPCPLVPLSQWQVWLPPQACEPTTAAVLTLRSRAAAL